MRMYWNEGNNQSFILLLDLMKRARVYADDLLNDDLSEGEKEEAEDYIGEARDFYDTFLGDAPKQWKNIAAPFLRGADNMKDFIAKDDELEEEPETEITHAMLHRQLAAEDEGSDENDLVHKIQRKYAEEREENEESVQSSDEEELEIIGDGDEYEDSEDGDDADIPEMKGYYSPIEEETDDWMRSKLNQRKKTPTSSSKRNIRETSNKTTTPIGKKLTKRKSTPSATKTPSPLIQLSGKKRTPAIQESDDEF